MKKNTIYLIIILVLGIVYLSISISQIFINNSVSKLTGTLDEIPQTVIEGGSVADPGVPSSTSTDAPVSTIPTDTLPALTPAVTPTPDTTPVTEITPTPTISPEDTECNHIMDNEWTSVDGTHFHRCTVEGCNYTDEPEICSGGNASCTEKAICSKCNSPYGDLSDHIWSENFAYCDASGHSRVCITPNCSAHSAMEIHIPGEDATQTTPQLCTVCSYQITAPLGHTHNITKIEKTDPDCTKHGNIEYYICSGCDGKYFDKEANEKIANDSEIIISPVGHDLTPATCSNPEKCKNCNYTVGTALSHKAGTKLYSDKNYHWNKCTHCDSKINKEPHCPGKEATETTPQTCTECGYVINDVIVHTHKYSTELKYDSEYHWRECTCSEKKDYAQHFDDNSDKKCDICTYPMPTPEPSDTEVPETTTPSDTIIQEGDKLEDILKPAQITLLRPVASGVLTKKSSNAIIDYSNYTDGYVMVKFTVDIDVRLKVQVHGPTTTYTYDIEPFEWNVFPLSDGNGQYRVKVLKNLEGTRYISVLSLTFDAELKDEFAPFLRPNQYVNYENATNTMNKAAELCTGKTDTLDKVAAIYSYVVNTLSYDYKKAATVQSGYLPDLDQVLAAKKGICFDYASLMTGMLRTQNIACKLIVGYADEGYHAWISVWTSDKGWVDGAIFFDGIKWQLMDPTFVSVGGNSAMDGVVYTTKYVY